MPRYLLQDKEGKPMKIAIAESKIDAELYALRSPGFSGFDRAVELPVDAKMIREGLKEAFRDLGLSAAEAECAARPRHYEEEESSFASRVDLDGVPTIKIPRQEPAGSGNSSTSSSRMRESQRQQFELRGSYEADDSVEALVESEKMLVEEFMRMGLSSSQAKVAARPKRGRY